MGAWSWAVEARSVNGRNLEVRFRGPPGFDGLERAAREAAQARFQRGQLTVGAAGAGAPRARGAVRVNREQLERYLALGAALCRRRPGRADPRLDGLLALRGVIEAADDGGRRRSAAPALERGDGRLASPQALDGLKAARRPRRARRWPAMLAGLVDQIEALTGRGRERWRRRSRR